MKNKLKNVLKNGLLGLVNSLTIASGAVCIAVGSINIQHPVMYLLILAGIVTVFQGVFCILVATSEGKGGGDR